MHLRSPPAKSAEIFALSAYRYFGPSSRPVRASTVAWSLDADPLVRVLSAGLGPLPRWCRWQNRSSPYDRALSIWNPRQRRFLFWAEEGSL